MTPEHRSTLVGLAALTAVAFAVRLAWFLQTAHPLGTDGYYYVVQTRDLVENGHLHVPDSSWVFALHRLIGAAFTPVLTTKIVAALLAAIAVPAAWFAGLSRSRQAAWVLACWAAASPTLTHLAADFPKNLGVAAPWLLLMALADEDRAGRARWPLVILCLTLLATAHRTGAVWAMVALVVWITSRGLGSRGARWALGLGLPGFLVLSAWLPGLLHLSDRFRLADQLGPSALSPFAWFSLRAFSLAQQVELSVAWIALLAGIVALLRARAWTSIAMATAFLAVCLLPIWRTDTLDLGYRLALLTPLLSFPILVLTLPALPSRFSVWAPAFALPLVTCAADPADLPPYDRYTEVLDRIEQPRPALLIAHQGLNFLYDYRTRDEAMAWAPEPELDRAGIGRIVWGIRESEWAAFGPSSRRRLDPQYSYLDEADWERFVRWAEQGDDDLSSRVKDWRNPARVRPAALTRGRVSTRP